VKIIIISIFFLINMYSELILVSNKNINYKEIINKDNLEFKSVSKNARCTMFDRDLLNKEKYQAKHFIFKNKEICFKDLIKVQYNKIQYDFGNILIQKDGKVIGENEEYVKIKKSDGSIEKIYKNGNNK